MSFIDQFDQEWGHLLGPRRDSFRKAFDFLLVNRPRGHLIVETGCARQVENWAGDGQSTYLFDRFATEFAGQVFSVDIEPLACAYARSIVGAATTVTTEDSVPFLRRLGRDLVKAGRHVDLLYLDSLDFDAANPTPSAVHHLKELCAIAPALGPQSLVIVDDCFRMVEAVRSSADSYVVIRDQGIGGKAMYVAQYFQQIGMPMLFEGYQCGWVITD